MASADYETYVLGKLAWLLNEAETLWGDDGSIPLLWRDKEINVILNRKPDWDNDAMVAFAEGQCNILQDKLNNIGCNSPIFDIEIGCDQYEFADEDDTIVKWEIYIRWSKAANPFTPLLDASTQASGYDSEDE